MSKILISTTNSFEGIEIKEYLDIVSTNVVVGTNYFSDLGASLTDIFGGYSDTYEGKLQTIYAKAIKNIQNQTIALGGNAIVGLKIDFDEISGKGKSMFMVSAIGTSVKLAIEQVDISKSKNSGTVSCEDLNNAITKSRIIYTIEIKDYLNLEQWTYLLNNPFSEVLEGLILQYLPLNSANIYSENPKLLVDNFDNLLSLSNQDDVRELLYLHICDDEYDIVKKLITLKLFSARHILDFIDNDKVDLAIKCLSIDKEFYTKDDLENMQIIVEKIDTLSDQGKIENVKGMFSKEKERFVCICGSKNDLMQEFCSDCGRNIKGLNYMQLLAIKDFKEKVYILSEILNR